MKHAVQCVMIGVVLMSGVLGTVAAGVTHVKSQGDDLSMLVTGNNDFAFDFYQRTAAGNDSNLIFSPFSISQAFGMLFAAGRSDTEQQIASAMHYTLPQDDLHPAFSALNADLGSRKTPDAASEGERLQLTIANSLWAQQDFPLRDAYIELMNTYYDGGLNLMDFVRAPEQARETINAWIEDQTENKIEDMIPPGTIDSDTRMVLVNAIYFNGSWLYPFQEYATQEDSFTLLDGTTTTVPMMAQQESFRYTAGNGFQAIELPYFGGDIAMLIVLPDEGEFATMQSRLDGAQFDAIRSAVSSQDIMLTMPRFEFETSLNLRVALTAMGMLDAFDPQNADFSGMFDPAAVAGNLFVTAALHKAFISVDEAGTEAAAATAIVMGITSAPIQQEPIMLRLDRPFIYAIYDQQTGAILFLGQVINPAE